MRPQVLGKGFRAELVILLAIVAASISKPMSLLENNEEVMVCDGW